MEVCASRGFGFCLITATVRILYLYLLMSITVWGGHWRGFCLSTCVLVLVPTTPNPTGYGLFLYQTCTFSILFQRKSARNRGCGGEPVFARANPQAGRGWADKTRPNIARDLFPRKFRLF
jgi:hypothetical protein